MKESSSPEPADPSPFIRFRDRPETQDVLNMAQERLNSLNEDYQELSESHNRGLSTHPYEQVTLFTIDKRPTDRASALVQAAPVGLEQDPRLEFSQMNIKNRRIILSQTALGEALGQKKPSIMASRMNLGKQAVWAHPLFTGDEQSAAIQLAFTVNQQPTHKNPGNVAIERVFQKHRESLDEVAEAIASLSSKTDSLSKSLEIKPPTTPNAFVISWDVKNSSAHVLTEEYAIHEAYLEAWKTEREKITRAYEAYILDRGDGEHIIVPIPKDLNNTIQVKLDAQRMMRPLIEKLQAKHAQVAHAFLPTLSPSVSFHVGIGNFEENQSGFLTSQAITETVKAKPEAGEDIAYTAKAKKILTPTDPNKNLPL
jgi:hypothetical protein